MQINAGLSGLGLDVQGSNIEYSGREYSLRPLESRSSSKMHMLIPVQNLSTRAQASVRRCHSTAEKGHPPSSSTRHAPYPVPSTFIPAKNLSLTTRTPVVPSNAPPARLFNLDARYIGPSNITGSIYEDGAGTGNILNSVVSPSSSISNNNTSLLYNPTPASQEAKNFEQSSTITPRYPNSSSSSPVTPPNVPVYPYVTQNHAVYTPSAGNESNLPRPGEQANNLHRSPSPPMWSLDAVIELQKTTTGTYLTSLPGLGSSN